MENHIRVVQASLLGSVLVNLLLILGTAIIAGSFNHEEMVYDMNATKPMIILLSLSVFSLLIPVS